MKGGLSQGALAGLGVAGLLLGALAAAVSSHSSPATPTPAPEDPHPAAPTTDPASALTASPPQTAPPDALAPTLDALAAAHQALHAAPAGDVPAGDRGFPQALRRAIESDKWFKAVRRELHERLGPAAFVDGGRLTGLGRALMDRLEALEAHAVDPKPYDLPALRERTAPLRADAAPAAPPEAGPAGATLVSILRNPAFDREHARERLARVEPPPTSAQVAAASRAASELLAAATGDEVHALEADLGRAFLRLVLDFRHARRAGPFKLRKNLEKYFDDPKRGKKRRKHLLDELVALAEAEDPVAALAGLDPKHPAYAPLLTAYARYRKLAADGGCKSLPEGWRIRPDMKGDEVARLQQRLACEGYYDGPEDGAYGEALLDAVKQYQRHHELPDEGFVFAETLKSLNVSMERRAEQIALTLLRLRESAAPGLGDFYIRVNVPAFELQVVEDGAIVRRQRVIVGTNRLDDDKATLVQGHINRTQLFTTRLYEIVAHPDWFLPVRVEQGELKAKLAEDPKYLEKQNIRKIQLDSGREVYVQRSGETNVLGKVKFLLEESNAIYLHDTDKRSLFRESRRDFSHGCIRVDDAVEFASWLLARDGYEDKDVARTFRGTTQRGFKMKKPIPLVTEYMTVDVSPEGLPVFLTDIYGYDRAYREGDLPPQVKVRWGHPSLRPHWVPKVPAEVVEGWRAAGKPAPRDYDPEKHGGG